MKTFEYPAQLKEMNKYISSLPASKSTFNNDNGTVTVEELKKEEGSSDAV